MYFNRSPAVRKTDGGKIKEMLLSYLFSVDFGCCSADSGCSSCCSADSADSVGSDCFADCCFC